MKKIALGLEYDGSLFHGWQRQSHLVSIQAELEKALSTIANTPIRTLCAGRTDAGVHATAQVVHFETTIVRQERAWVFGTNSELNPAIRVLWAREVPPNFNARRSATGREYRYVIYNHPVRPSLLKKKVTWIFRELNVQKMMRASKAWVGTHDFSSFRAAECQSLSPIRTVYAIEITKTGDYITLDFSANAFLHHMVRNMVGVLMAIGTGKKPPSWALETLQAKERRQAGVTAPPDGLYLVGIEYPKAFGLPQVEKKSWIFY